MSDEKKTPVNCNHCRSTNIIFHVWGRSEYWSCTDCKKEVTYSEPKVDAYQWTAWDPKVYGFGSTDFKYTAPVGGVYRVTLPDGLTYDTTTLPTGSIISVPNRDINQFDDEGDYGDDGF